MALDFWFDGQLRRYWLQFSRIFQGFQYQYGVDDNGKTIYRTVPVRLASKDRQINHIISNNSENFANTVPHMTCEMTGLALAPERRQTPNYVSAVSVWERQFDPYSKSYTGEPGKRYTVERYMPVPYNMTMQMALWTSNEMQKHQLLEQILTLFNPSIDIQTSDNPLDWTSLTYVELTGIEWTNRTMPIGSDDSIDISTLTFEVPIWLTPPAKVKRQTLIHQIITNIFQQEDGQSLDPNIIPDLNLRKGSSFSRDIITPGNLKIQVNSNILDDGSKQYEVNLVALANSKSNEILGNEINWQNVILTYGKYNEGISQLRLKMSDNLDDEESDIIGTFTFHPNKPDTLIWNVDPDSFPSNTLSPIDGVLDIKGKIPGVNMPSAQKGQRYLLISDLDPSSAWDNLEASINDIVEYDGTQWFKAFDSVNTREVHYLQNLRSGKQLKWTGQQWGLVAEGEFGPGYWRLYL